MKTSSLRFVMRGKTQTEKKVWKDKEGCLEHSRVKYQDSGMDSLLMVL